MVRKKASAKAKAKAKPKARRSSSASRAISESREYEAQEDLRTLKRADEIRRDKKRLAEVEKQLKKEQAAINSLRRGIGGRK